MPRPRPIVLVALLVACDGAAPLPDGGHDAAPPGACAPDLVVVLGAAGQRVVGELSGPREDVVLRTDDLACGPVDLARPVQLIELRAPAGEAFSGTFSLAVDGTAPTLDTVVEVRTRCDDVVDSSCSDDGPGGERRSSGAFQVPAGGSAFLAVSGHSPADVGPYAIEISVASRTRPTITSARAVRAAGGSTIRVAVVGEDSDGDVVALEHSYYGADALLAPGVIRAGQPDLEGRMYVEAFATTGFLSSVDDLRYASEAHLRLIDAHGDASDEVVLEIGLEADVGEGDACDALRGPSCRFGLRCSEGTCVDDPARQGACEMLERVPFEPGPVTTSWITTAELPAGHGEVVPLCTAGGYGGERAYEMTLPATGRFDVIASTEGATDDTVLYAATECGVQGTEISTACNDDVGGGPTWSRIELRDALPGVTYVIVADSYAYLPSARSVPLTVSLRPVRGSGAACDPAEQLDRCASAACPSTGEPICP